MLRRTLLKKLLSLIPVAGAWEAILRRVLAQGTVEDYSPKDHYYGMGIQVDKCIGCGRCLEACQIENDVPEEPFFVRTWVERYVINRDDEVSVERRNRRNQSPRET
jgi:tetrathionate reductase subunit B